MFDSTQNVSLGVATGTGSGGKNSHINSVDRKQSLKGSNYHTTSKSSHNNGLHGNNNNTSSSPGTATPTRSKVGSAANTAPASPMMQPLKLSLNLGTMYTRSSVSTMPTPTSPQINLTIHRSATPKNAPMTMSELQLEGVPALDLTQLQPTGQVYGYGHGGAGAGAGAEHRSSQTTSTIQPTIHDPNTPGTGNSSNDDEHFTPASAPAKNFI